MTNPAATNSEAHEFTSRERVLKALNHEEPDRVPYDLSSTHVTGITNGAYQQLRRHLGLEERPTVWADVIQQLALPDPDLLDYLQVDTRGLYPLTSHNWNVYEQLQDGGEVWEYRDEWDIEYHFPKQNGHWFSTVASPLEAIDPGSTSTDAVPYTWPNVSDKKRVQGLRALAQQYRQQGKIVVLKGICAGVFEMQQRLRGMQNALMDTALYPDFTDYLVGRLADVKIAFWEMALAELKDVVDIVLEADDYGTQESQMVSPDTFRKLFKPHVQRVLQTIRNCAPNVRILFHSCGNVRDILPDFIEIGVDILNPVHVRASGMEPSALKRDFGDDICFWGGGVDTQGVLSKGTPQEVADDTRRNLDSLAPGGGYIFNTIHNIQSEVPPENIMAMWTTLQEHGRYS
jgi:uroporphyrinogen decarboxylase